MSRRIAKNLARVKPGTVYVGVDMALEQNVALVLNERAQILDQFRFPNDRGGYDFSRHRLERLRQRQQAPAVLVGMEPTNYFWKLYAAYLEQYQLPYRLVNPYTVKKAREGDRLDRSKDDPRDAFTIGDLLRTGKYTETQLLHGPYATLRQYATLLARLKQELRRQKNLISNLSGQLFPELPQEFQDLTGATALALLRSCAAASVVRQLSTAAFVAQVRRSFAGRQLAVAKLRRAHQLAASSVGLEGAVPALQLSLRLHIETLETLRDQCAQAQSALVDTFLVLPAAPYMLSVPALGMNTAAQILAEIGDPSHYHRIGQWVKLAGLQPVPNTSGRKTRSQTPMSHQGRAGLRTALFFAVLRLVQVDDAFGRLYLYYQQREHNPLTKMQALGVLMNKLLRVLWALIKQQTFYNPAFIQPA